MADLTARMILELVDRLSGPARTAARRMSALTKSANNMAKSFERINENSRKARTALRRLGADAKKLPAMGGPGMGMGRGRAGPGGVHEIWGRGTMEMAGRNMMSFARTSSRALMAPLGVLARFDHEMAKVAADTRNLAKEDFEALRAKAKEIGETTKFTAAEAARGMHFLAKSSFDARQQLEGIDHVMNLAAAGAIEIGRASDIATDIMKAFGMEAKELGRVSDVLATASTMSTTDINQMGQAFKHVAGPAKQAGVSFEESAAFIASFASMGLKSGMGGRNLKRVLISLAAPSKIAAKELESLTIAGERLKLKDAAGEMRRPVDIFRDMAIAMRDMPGGERLAKMHRIFQAFGMTGAGGAVEQFAEAMAKSTDETKVLTEIEKILNATLEETGAASKKAADRMNSLMGDSIKAKSAMEGLSLAIADAVNEDVRELLQEVTKLVQGFSKWAKENKPLVSLLFKTWAGVTLVAGVLGPLVITVATLTKGYMMFQSAMAASNATAAASGPALTKVSLGLKSVAASIGPMLTVGYIAAMFGMWADSTWKLSDRLAGLNEQIDRFGNLTTKLRGAPAMLGNLTEGEREQLSTAQEELEAAKKQREERRSKWGWLLTDRALDWTGDADERMTDAARRIEEINLRGRERERTGRAGYEEGFAGPTPEMLGLKIRVESDVPVKTRVELENEVAGMRAMIENLGLQGAGG